MMRHDAAQVGLRLQHSKVDSLGYALNEEAKEGMGIRLAEACACCAMPVWCLVLVLMWWTSMTGVITRCEDLKVHVCRAVHQVQR